MEVLYARCAGLDVHKDTVVACARQVVDRSVKQDVATFATTTSGLLALGDWPGGSPEVYVRRLLGQHPGVMVTAGTHVPGCSARVLRKRLVSPEQPDISRRRRARIGPWEAAGELRTYFRPAPSPLACTQFKSGHTQQHFVQRLCCDRDPPTSVACLFGVDEIRDVPKWAERLLRKTT